MQKQGTGTGNGKGTDLQHDLGNLHRMSSRTGTAHAGTGKGLRTGRGVGDVGFVVGTVEIFAIPAAVGQHERLYLKLTCTVGILGTHVGYKMLDRIPPRQGLFGRASVSRLRMSVFGTRK